MADVNASINLLINTGQASSELQRLSTQISAFNRATAASNGAAAARTAALNKALVDAANASGMFSARMVPMQTSVERFSTALEKNKLTLGEYTRMAASQIPGLGRVFAREFNLMERVATDRVKRMQTQFVALGKSAKGVEQAISLVPNSLEKGFSTQMAVASQKAQILNKIIDDGSTKMLNWGKNTQWAGRQLMVGFSIPLAALGSIAAKTFMELDKATLSLERVYGDLNTSTAEVERNSEAIRNLGVEYTKYGIAVKDTVALGARAAATGATNETLMAATEQTLRFATLGQIEYNQALDTTISLQTAFGISNDELASKIDFLNAVENQTILTIEDMSLAIPRVATVIKGLGGSVEDLAVMMTAMREGGVSAENAANALKSGLASLINPTTRASEALKGMGVNLDEMIAKNRGNLMGLVQDFGKALNSIDSFSRQQALEKIFGKYQYARMSALFTNIASDAGQAARAMDLAGRSAEELAAISEKELSKISETTSVKFQAAMEQLKISIAPLGEAFLKGIMPIMEVLTKLANAFNELPDGVKNAIAVVTGVVAGLGPVFLMTFGLIANGFANIVKLVQFFRKTLARVKGNAQDFQYLADAELDAAAAARTLEGSLGGTTKALLLQQSAVAELITLYQRLATSMAIPGFSAGGSRSVVSRGAGSRAIVSQPMAMARGGVVPGSGNKDTIPAMLTPGETVVNKQASQKYGPVIAAMNAGTLPGYNTGLDPVIPRGRQSTSTISGVNLLNYAPGGFMFPGNNQFDFGLDPAFIRDTQGMLDAIKVGLAAGAADIRGMTGRTENIRAIMAGFATDLDSDVSRIVTALQDTQNELASAGTHAGTIDELLQAARTRLTPVLDEMTAAGGVRADAARYFVEGHLDPTAEAAIARGEKRDITTKYDTATGEYKKWTTGRTGGISNHQRLSAIGWEPILGTPMPESREYAHTFDSKFLGGEKEMMGRVVTSDALGSPERRQSAITKHAEVEQAVLRRMIADGVVIAAEGGQQIGRTLGMSTVAGLEATALPAMPMVGHEIANVLDSTIENSTQDPYLSMRDRNSPHAQVAPDAKSDATTYASVFASQVKNQIRGQSTQNPSYADQVKRLILTGEGSPTLPSTGGSGLSMGRFARTQVAGSRAMSYARATGTAGTMLGATITDAISSSKKTFVAAAQTAARQSTPALRNIFSGIMQPFKDNLSRAAVSQAGSKSGQFDINSQRGLGRAGAPNLVQGRLPQSMGTELVQIARGVGSALREVPSAIRGIIPQIKEVGSNIATAGKVAKGEIATSWKQIPVQFDAMKAGIKSSFGSAIQAVKTGGSSLGSAISNAAARLKGTMMGAIDPTTGEKIPGKLGRSAMGAGMALSMGSMLPMMMQNEEGKFAGMDAGTASMGMMGGGMLLSMVGTVPAPLLAVGAAAVAAGIAFKAVRESVDATSRKMAEFGANIGGTANSLNNIAAILGEKTPTQSRTQMSLGMTQEEAETNYGRFQSALEGEQGQAFLDQLKGSSSADRFKILGDYVKSAIAAGMMDSNTGAAFAKTVAAAINDPVVGQSVAQAVAGQKSGPAAMLQLAKDRMAKTDASDGIKAILGGGGRKLSVDYEQASAGIGSSLQVIQDFSNAAASAAEQYQAGTISFSEYKDIVDQAAAAQTRYTGIINDALNSSTDTGGSRQALKAQLGTMGVDEDAWAALESATFGAGPSGFLSWWEGEGTEADKKIERQRMADASSAVASGVSVQNVTAALEASKVEGSRAKEIYDTYQGQAGAIEKTIFATSVDSGMFAGAKTEEDMDRVIEIGVALDPQSLANYQAFLAGIPETKQMEIIATLEGLSEEERKAFIDQGQRLSTAGGEEVRSMVQGSKEYTTAISEGDVDKTEKMTKAVEKASEAGVFGDNLTTVISMVLNEDPSNLETRLPLLTNYATELNEKVPADVLKTLGIELSNKDDLDKYGPLADELANLTVILDQMPEGIREIGIGLMLDENGDPVSPEQFGKDAKKVTKAYNNLSSTKKSVKKQAALTILQSIKDADGNTLSADEATAAWDALEKEYGKQKIMNLPPDIMTKVLATQVKITGMEEALAAMDAQISASAALNPGGKPDASLLQRRAALVAAIAKAKAAQAASVAAGQVAAAANNSGSSGSGGGGGGEKKDPYKDFKAGIVEQLKKFADLDKTVKNLLSSKENFFDLLKKNNGLDDKIRKAGIVGPMAEQIMGLSPEDAEKVLGKMTGKNGRLNKEGRKLQDSFMAGQITETQYNNQMSIDSAMAQSRALRNSQFSQNNYVMPKKPNKAYGKWTSTGLNSYGMQALTDPAIAKQYNFLADKMIAAIKKTGAGAVKAYNAAAKALSDYTKEMERAATLQAGMAAIVDYDISKKKAKETASLVSQAQAAGLSQEAIDDIASGNQTDRYMGLVATRDQRRKEAKANPKDKAAQKRWREAQAAVDNFFTNFEQDMADMETRAAKANPLQYLSDQVSEEMEIVNAEIQEVTATLTEMSNVEFEASFGKTKDEAELLIKKNQVIIDQYQRMIDKIQEKISEEQHEIDLLERSKKQYQDQIDKIQDIIDGHQRKIDGLQHEIDLRNHAADLINHELDILSRAEDQINKSYDDRIEALSRIQQINEHLIQQQQRQIGLAQAFASGDVYAAAQAAAEMQAGQVQYAGQMNMDALEQGRENAINGLRTSDGMTREQAEERLWQISQQNWQTEQEIYALNQLIYAENQKIIPLKDAIAAIDDQIAAKNDIIWQKSQEIYDIQKNSIKPLQDQNVEWQARLKTSADNLEIAINQATLDEKAKLRDLELQQAQIKRTQLQAQHVNRLGKAWKNVTEQIAEANRLLNDRTKLAAEGKWEELGNLAVMTDDGDLDLTETMAAIRQAYSDTLSRIREDMANLGTNADVQNAYTGGLIRMGAAGLVGGVGARDTVPAMLTPGEYVIRKSMVDKYGKALFERINTGSFSIPRFNVPKAMEAPSTVGSRGDITANVTPVYNTYSVNVNASTNASPDDIATTVINKIRRIEDMTVRSLNGY